MFWALEEVKCYMIISTGKYIDKLLQRNGLDVKESIIKIELFCEQGCSKPTRT